MSSVSRLLAKKIRVVERILTLIVKGNPLRLSCSFNTFKGHGAVVTGDACKNDIVARKVLKISGVFGRWLETHCFLLEGVAGRLRVNSAILFSLDCLVLSGFTVAVSRVSLSA